jgi:hypothetical protein
VSTRKALAIRRAEFISEVITAAPQQSRAEKLVASGMIDVAANVASLSHDLADATIDAIRDELLERGGVADLQSVRSAAFGAIARCVIERLDRKGR